MLALILSLFHLCNPGDLHEAHHQNTAEDSLRQTRHHAVKDSTNRLREINRIFIIGNRITRDHIILRELTYKTGDTVYSFDLPRVLDLDKKKLINTRLFNTVDIRILELDSTRMDVLIDVTERWYTFPSPVFELFDRNFNEWWQNYNHDFDRVNYGLRLYQFNMRGRNETLGIHVQFGYSRKFDLSYRIPYIDKKRKHGLSFALQYMETKNMPFQTNDHKLEYVEADHVVQTVHKGALTYLYRPSFYQSHALRMEYVNTRIDNSIAELKPGYLGNENVKQHFLALTYQFTSDHRDYIAYPLKGHYFTTFVTKSGLTASDDLHKLEASFIYAGFLDLTKGFYFSNNVIGYASVPTDLPYYNYSALGYKKQFVRGYEVYVIEGPAYLLNKMTLKKRIFARTYHWQDMPIPQFRHIPFAVYLKMYADVGYVSNYPGYWGTRLTDKLLTGIGSGIDLTGSYDVVLRLEYSYNGEGRSGFFVHVKKEF